MAAIITVFPSLQNLHRARNISHLQENVRKSRLFKEYENSGILTTRMPMTYGSSKITVKITCIYIAIYIYTVTTIKLYVLDNPILFTVYNILNKRLYNLFYTKTQTV